MPKITYKVEYLPKNPDTGDHYDLVWINWEVPAYLLKEFNRGGLRTSEDKSTIKDGEYLLENEIQQFVSGKYDDHDCFSNVAECTDDGTCDVTTLWTLRKVPENAELAKAHWFVVVSLVKLAVETREVQEFTLKL